MRGNINCPCCGLGGLDESFSRKLKVAEEMTGEEFNVTSGYRCWSHNKDVGGSKTSSHLIGLAVDIEIKSDAHRYEVEDSLKRVGITRLGIYKTFIHADVDSNKNQRRLWVK